MTIWSGEIVSRLNMGGYFRDDLSYDDIVDINAAASEGIRDIVGTAFDLATPRTDSDEGTAGEAKPHPFSLVGRPSDDMLYAALEWLKQTKDVADNLGIQLKATAADYAVRSLLSRRATPPGVPDSVREMPDGAIHNGREHLRRLGLYGFTANDGHALDNCEDYIGAQQCFEAMAEALRDTHPAGQSTAPEPDPTLIYWIESQTERLCNLYPDAASSIVEFREELVGLMEGDPAGQSTGLGAEAMRAKAAEVARNNAAASGDGELYIAHKIADEIEALALPAPDSTRTGPVGTEGGVQAAAKAMAEFEGLDWSEMPETADMRWQTTRAGKSYWRNLARIAARPADPEAQGTEPSPTAEACRQAARRAAEQLSWSSKPALPSSGQGGR